MMEEIAYRFLHSDDQAYETLAMMYGIPEDFLRENLWKSTGRL